MKWFHLTLSLSLFQQLCSTWHWLLILLLSSSSSFSWLSCLVLCGINRKLGGEIDREEENNKWIPPLKTVLIFSVVSGCCCCCCLALLLSLLLWGAAKVKGLSKVQCSICWFLFPFFPARYVGSCCLCPLICFLILIWPFSFLFFFSSSLTSTCIRVRTYV